MNDFQTQLELRLDWSEMDMFGHINNVAFFKYIQSSRVNYWEHFSILEDYQKTNIGPILHSCHCDFKKPLHYPDTITIQAQLDFIKNSSFGLYHQILNGAGEIVAEAKDVIVMYNFNTNEKHPIPQALREQLSNS